DDVRMLMAEAIALREAAHVQNTAAIFCMNPRTGAAHDRRRRPVHLPAPTVQNGFALGAHCQGSRSRSRLPPVRMMPTRLPRTSILFSTMAAYGTAPDGSTTIFSTSHTARIAATIDSSVTVTMSETWLRISAKVRSLVELRKPSAMVFACVIGMNLPALNERLASSAPAGSAPITRMPG